MVIVSNKDQELSKKRDEDKNCIDLVRRSPWPAFVLKREEEEFCREYDEGSSMLHESHQWRKTGASKKKVSSNHNLRYNFTIFTRNKSMTIIEHATTTRMQLYQ